jgi:hypothetical protein
MPCCHARWWMAAAQGCTMQQRTHPRRVGGLDSARTSNDTGLEELKKSIVGAWAECCRRVGGVLQARGRSVAGAWAGCCRRVGGVLQARGRTRLPDGGPVHHPQSGPYQHPSTRCACPRAAPALVYLCLSAELASQLRVPASSAVSRRVTRLCCCAALTCEGGYAAVRL